MHKGKAKRGRRFRRISVVFIKTPKRAYILLVDGETRRVRQLYASCAVFLTEMSREKPRFSAGRPKTR